MLAQHRRLGQGGFIKQGVIRWAVPEKKRKPRSETRIVQWSGSAFQEQKVGGTKRRCIRCDHGVGEIFAELPRININAKKWFNSALRQVGFQKHALREAEQ